LTTLAGPENDNAIPARREMGAAYFDRLGRPNGGV
jgi:hypothetical protein